MYLVTNMLSQYQLLKKSRRQCRECSSVFHFQPKNETVLQLQRERQAKQTNQEFVCTKTWSNRVGCSVSKMFSSPKCNPHLSTFISSTTEIASTKTSVSVIRRIIFFCSMKKYSCVGLFMGAYGSGLLLWLMRPRCHRKWRRVFCEKLLSILLERKQNRSLLFSSFFKMSMRCQLPKVTPYDVDLLLFAPTCKLSAR